MAVVTHPRILPRPDLWHGRYRPAIVLTLVVLPFAAALAWAAMSPSISQEALGDGIRDTAALVDDHAAAMIRVGERISSMAAVATTPDRATWASYGQHMINDGRGLQALGERLRRTAIVAESDQVHKSAEVAVAVLQARWEQLRADGRATAEHGRVMVRMAEDLRSAVAAGVLSEADLDEIRTASAGMAEAGDRVMRFAGTLLASTGQMERWMGAGR